MMWEEALPIIIEWRVFALVVEIVLITGMLFAERDNQNKIIVWMLVFLIAPILGFIIYLFVGQTFYAEHTFRLKGISDKEVKSALHIEDKLIETDEKNMDPETVTMVKAIRNIGGASFSNNNDIKLYTEGEDFFDDMLKDIEGAKKFIHLEYYILRNDELGNRFMELITRKAKDGVEVRLLVDSMGLQKGTQKAIKKFVRAGGDFTTFHKIPVLLLSPKKNNRNHRKLTIVDGDIAYCGGFNIGDEYLGKGKFGYWRDTAVRIRGGGCIPISSRFLMDWDYAYTKPFPDIELGKFIPMTVLDKWGDDRMQLVSGGPDIAWKNPVRLQYLQMIKMAKKRVWIHTPYLIPNDSILDELTLAAASGVDVRIMIPDRPDHIFVYWNNLHSANRLMEAGVHVYHYHRGFLHSKTALVDDSYCSVGSANIDDRSLVLNFESNAMIYSERIAKELEAAYLEDLKYCTEYSCEEYRNRSLGMKIRIGFSRLFRNLS